MLRTSIYLCKTVNLVCVILFDIDKTIRLVCNKQVNNVFLLKYFNHHLFCLYFSKIDCVPFHTPWLVFHNIICVIKQAVTQVYIHKKNSPTNYIILGIFQSCSFNWPDILIKFFRTKFYIHPFNKYKLQTKILKFVILSKKSKQSCAQSGVWNELTKLNIFPTKLCINFLLRKNFKFNFVEIVVFSCFCNKNPYHQQTLSFYWFYSKILSIHRSDV